jgi:hypothetical protein
VIGRLHLGAERVAHPLRRVALLGGLLLTAETATAAPSESSAKTSAATATPSAAGAVSAASVHAVAALRVAVDRAELARAFVQRQAPMIASFVFGVSACAIANAAAMTVVTKKVVLRILRLCVGPM